MTIGRLLAAFALTVATLALSGCLEEKVLDIVLTGETSTEFSQNEVAPQWAGGALIDMAQEMRDILEANGYDESDLKDAKVTSASYGVTSFDQAHDWSISGTISVTYNGNTQALVHYASQSVQGALGEKISAPLVAAGVDVINAALQDFLDGESPVLIFAITNESTTPAPSPAEPMVFEWRAWLAVQVIINESVEVPDPF